jgi:hypothetical protein
VNAEGRIPIALVFDVEPDDRQIAPGGTTSWSGFEAIFDFVDRFHSQLANVSGAEPSFGWFFRMDPQIEETHGSADFVARRFDDHLRHLERRGDHFGVHVHALRWSGARRLWYNDVEDRDWVAHCVDTAFDAYANAFGESPIRHRFGGGYFSDRVAAQIACRGARVDLTLEPGVDFSTVGTPDPVVGRLADFRRVPTHPYRPSERDFRVPRTGGSGSLVLVPLTVTAPRRDGSVLRRVARSVRRRFRTPDVSLYLWRQWPTANAYWDVVESYIDSTERRYLALVVRTDAADSRFLANVRVQLTGLLDHALGRRLVFVDPLELAVSGAP